MTVYKNKKALSKVMTASTALLLDEPFWGSLLARLDLIEDPTTPTEWTNGKVIAYNPSFIESIPFEQVKDELRHETEHNARLHPFRRDNRDPRLWNDACDYVINLSMVEELGRNLDATWLVDRRFRGMSEEQVYTVLDSKQRNPQQQGQGLSSGLSSAHGEVRDAPNTLEQSSAELAQQWQTAILQAAQIAQKAGKLPASMQSLINQIKHPAIDWRAALRRFLEQVARNDFTWTRPNRRYLSHGLYLPSIHSEQLPPVVIYRDTSGSRWDERSRQLAINESFSVVQDAKPSLTYILDGDTAVRASYEIAPGDVLPAELKGGGGTSFEPIFEWIADNEVEPCCFIGITDLEGSFPSEAPPYPVLWVCDNREAPTPPFGEILLVEERE